jgi:DNA replication protein DnaC
VKEPKNFLVFCGSPGLGKTYFCASLTEWAFKTFSSFRYYNEAQLLQRIRDGMESFKGDYLRHLAHLIDDPLIMIDDIGSQGVNEWRAEVMFDAIDNRYNTMLPTILTSNFTKKQIEQTYHPRLASRIFAKENIIIEIHDGLDKRTEGK